MRQKSVSYLSQGPGILSPHQVQLYGHGEHEGGEVGHGEVEQVDVGGGPHVLVPHDHYTGGQVAQHTQHKKQTEK